VARAFCLFGKVFLSLKERMKTSTPGGGTGKGGGGGDHGTVPGGGTGNDATVPQKVAVDQTQPVVVGKFCQVRGRTKAKTIRGKKKKQNDEKEPGAVGCGRFFSIVPLNCQTQKKVNL